MKRSQGMRYIACLSLALLACGGSGGNLGGDGGGGGGGGGWHLIALHTQENNDVTGVYCTATNKCVIATHGIEDPSGVFAASDTSVSDNDSDTPLVDGNGDNPDLTSVTRLATPDFPMLGFQKIGDKLMVRLDDSDGYVTAPLTDIMTWTIGPMTSDHIGLSSQYALQCNGSNCIFINEDAVFSSTNGPPSNTAKWNEIWDPTAADPVPNDIHPDTECTSNIAVPAVSQPSNPVWVSPDLQLVLLPAAPPPETSDDPPGVCVGTGAVSTMRFRKVAFPANPTPPTEGPRGLFCLDNSTCFAFGSGFIYRTEKASTGTSNDWTSAQLPSALTDPETINFKAMFFAPDNMHGWVVGSSNGKNTPLLARTKDGGKTWEDVSTAIHALGNALRTTELLNGFALDQDHIWVTGHFGALAATATAQR